MSQHLPHDLDPPRLAPPLKSALAQLARAQDYAHEARRDEWQFAVELERLLDLGATTSDLRWLLTLGLVRHAHETTCPPDAERKFAATDNLGFSPRSCFVVTAAGRQALAASAKRETPAPVATGPRPTWDRNLRMLSLDGLVIKHFRVPSRNQEAVLAAFEEEGWPVSIDDPLPPVGDQQPKNRLRDTVRGLNTNQINQLLRFRGDGTGQRVLWELIDR